MPGAQIPIDVSAELKCYPVWWPSGGHWQGILLGQLSEPIRDQYWDGNLTEQGEASEAVLRAFYQTLDRLDMGGCFMVGEIKVWPSADVPNGWQSCDGTFFPIEEYSELFGVIGYSFGSGMGGDVFAVPDLRRRVPVGLDTGQSPYDQVGNIGGESSHLLTVGEMPSHTHPNKVGGDAGGSFFYRGYTAGGITNDPNGGLNKVTTGATGGGQTHNNLQPYLVTNYIIYTGVFTQG